MNIVINTEILPEAYWWNPENPVTGTTKFYVRTAEALVRKGHAVTVRRDQPDCAAVSGVNYVPRGVLLKGPVALQIDCNVQTAERAFTRLQWTNFYNRPGVCVGEGYDGLLLASPFHHTLVGSSAKAPVTIVELGTDLKDLFYPKLQERPKQLCYTSAPDRGLDFLRAIAPEVQEKTGYTLVASSYGQGASDADVCALLDSSRFWLHPALGVELYCLAAVEAMARGCIPFVVPHMALADTLRYGITTDIFSFKDRLIDTLNAADDDFFVRMAHTRDACLAARPLPTWDDVADKVLNAAGT